MICLFFRLKCLQEEPFTQAEADRAAGMGSYVAPKTLKIVTQDTKDVMEESD